MRYLPKKGKSVPIDVIKPVTQHPFELEHTTRFSRRKRHLMPHRFVTNPKHSLRALKRLGFEIGILFTDKLYREYTLPTGWSIEDSSDTTKSGDITKHVIRDKKGSERLELFYQKGVASSHAWAEVLTRYCIKRDPISAPENPSYYIWDRAIGKIIWSPEPGWEKVSQAESHAELWIQFFKWQDPSAYWPDIT
jgi:hypothetical protein